MICGTQLPAIRLSFQMPIKSVHYLGWNGHLADEVSPPLQGADRYHPGVDLKDARVRASTSETHAMRCRTAP